jgi:two-component system sensor histidine kinase KdpD
VTIEVADGGPGLPPGSEEKVFEKFYRGPHTGIPGAGLGLPICRGIAFAHGGNIRGFNGPGGGAVFQITLPVKGAPPSTTAETIPADLAASREGASA